MRLDPSEALALFGELIRLTAPPAAQDEICEQGLALTARALGARGGLLLLRQAPSPVAAIAASTGSVRSEDLARADVISFEAESEVEPLPDPGDRPEEVVLRLRGREGPLGTIVLFAPAHWGESARSFASQAARALAASLETSRGLVESRIQGELLARRNLELEALRELSSRLQEEDDEDHLLRTSLDLVLKRLGLEAGWIFWGDSGAGRLELAACHGVAEAWEEKARRTGIGTCLCKDVFETGRLQYARNTTDCPRLPELLPGAAPMTHACIPLKFDRGVLGVLNIANRPGRLFTPEELHFLETVGTQICLAVDKARTSRAETRRNAEARALVSLARAIGGSLDQEHVLAAVGNYAKELLSTDRCAIFLGESPSSVVFSHLSGQPISTMEVGQAIDFQDRGSRALVEALFQRRTLVVRDASNDPRANSDLARQWEIGSAIVIPLVSHDRLQGLLLASRTQPSSWSQEEVALADALAGQAAVAIENARLYRETQDAFVRLQQAQYTMMRSERMAAVGTLASSLAHEVRNPLNSINLQLVLLSRRMSKLEEANQSELASLVETARREITRLDTLVEEFLSLSSIDRIALGEADPEEVVREVHTLMAPVARERGISTTLDLQGSLPRVRMDREKIKQVMLNLARNSIEAMPEGGTLTLSSSLRNSTVEIKVADTGSGIEPGIDVFDFFMTTKRGGTGLGLPIARRIVEAHEGNLTYESQPGRGTVFTIALKASRPDDE